MNPALVALSLILAIVTAGVVLGTYGAAQVFADQLTVSVL
jgi:hypothetical protein